MSCAICNTRKEKRSCPAKGAGICAVCCATEREQTLDCPLSCEYLRAAHRHEKSEAEFDFSTAPNKDIVVSDDFVEEYQLPMAIFGTVIVEAVKKLGDKPTDQDAREALESLIQKLRGADSGLVVDAPLVNPYAVGIREALEGGYQRFRALEEKATGKSVTDEPTFLKMLVFLQRLEFANNNGRRYGRAFISFLGNFNMPMPPLDEVTEAPADEPQVVLQP